MTLQHSSLRFDLSHTSLCESIRCVVPLRTRLLAHFDTFQTRGCSTVKRQQCPAAQSEDPMEHSDRNKIYFFITPCLSLRSHTFRLSSPLGLHSTNPNWYTSVLDPTVDYSFQSHFAPDRSSHISASDISDPFVKDLRTYLQAFPDIVNLGAH